DLHPRQQLEPDAARRLTRARRRRRRRLGGRVGRDGGAAMSDPSTRPPLTREEFIDWVRREGESRYHDHHRYHHLMHDGKLTRLQLQQWVLNRYYYQTRVPIKDALILAKSEDPAFRRMWIRRIRDHDGDSAGEGGLELWLRRARRVSDVIANPEAPQSARGGTCRCSRRCQSAMSAGRGGRSTTSCSWGMRRVARWGACGSVGLAITTATRPARVDCSSGCDSPAASPS